MYIRGLGNLYKVGLAPASRADVSVPCGFAARSATSGRIRAFFTCWWLAPPLALLVRFSTSYSGLALCHVRATSRLPSGCSHIRPIDYSLPVPFYLITPWGSRAVSLGDDIPLFVLYVALSTQLLVAVGGFAPPTSLPTGGTYRLRMPRGIMSCLLNVLYF